MKYFTNPLGSTLLLMIEETKYVRKIVLLGNQQDPTMMKNPQHAIEKVNALKIHGPRVKIMNFSLLQS